MAISSLLSFPHLISGLDSSYFRSMLYRQICESIDFIEVLNADGTVPLEDLGILIDRPALQDELGDIGLATIGSMEQGQFWVRALQDIAVAANIDDAIKRLLDLPYPDSPGIQRLDSLKSIIEDNQPNVVTAEIPTLLDAVKTYSGKARANIESGSGGTLNVGHSVIDRLIKGLRPGELTLLASDAGSGKSTYVGNLTRSLARQEKVCYIASAEMSQDQLAEIESDVLVEKSVDSVWTDIEEVNRLDRLLDLGIDYLENIYLDNQWEIRFPVLESRVRSIMSKKPVHFLAIDHADHCSFKDQNIDDIERHRKTMLCSKGLARSLNIPVLVLAHINRDAERQMGEGQKPKKSWLRGSTHLTQVPDNVIIMVRDYDKPETEFFVVKSRMGVQGSRRMKFNVSTRSFSEI